MHLGPTVLATIVFSIYILARAETGAHFRGQAVDALHTHRTATLCITLQGHARLGWGGKAAASAFHEHLGLAQATNAPLTHPLSVFPCAMRCAPPHLPAAALKISQGADLSREPGDGSSGSSTSGAGSGGSGGSGHGVAAHERVWRWEGGMKRHYASLAAYESRGPHGRVVVPCGLLEELPTGAPVTGAGGRLPCLNQKHAQEHSRHCLQVFTPVSPALKCRG